jgi:hypothetical protein
LQDAQTLHCAPRGQRHAAKKLAAKGEKEQADSMLLRAESDAELAVMLSHEDAEKAEAMAAVARVSQLRKDNK